MKCPLLFPFLFSFSILSIFCPSLPLHALPVSPLASHLPLAPDRHPTRSWSAPALPGPAPGVSETVPTLSLVSVPLGRLRRTQAGSEWCGPGTGECQVRRHQGNKCRVRQGTASRVLPSLGRLTNLCGVRPPSAPPAPSLLLLLPIFGSISIFPSYRIFFFLAPAFTQILSGTYFSRPQPDRPSP